MAKGLVHIYTGDGKGKTTAAIGLAFRALGHNKKVYILQFLKARNTGEKRSAEKIQNITFARANRTPKFIYQMTEDEKSELVIEIREIWNKLVKITQDSKYDIIILDEIMGAIANNLVELDRVTELVENKGDNKELILTGRDAPTELIKMADYVTEMKLIKHPYKNNIPARKGIEF